MSQQNYILAEFKGTYRAPHPEGFREQNITKDFHVRVKMKRECLLAPGLNGLFATYYKEFLRKLKPDMIDLYVFDLVQATELNGATIYDPKALSHDGLMDYINQKKYPINPLLYSMLELRDQVVLFEQDPKGQQHLQDKLQNLKGNMLATSAELRELEDLMVEVGVDDDSYEIASPTLSKGSKNKASSKASKDKSFVEALA